jgi:transposase
MNSEASTFSTITLPPELFDSLPTSVQSYIRFLETHIQQLQAQVVTLENQVVTLQMEVADLKAQLAKNSSNSSKPPGSDGLRKQPKSQRNKSDKKSGGQAGHAGKTRTQIANPDHIEIYTPTSCQGCGSDLTDVNGSCVEKRQVFDVPQPQIEVTEHQVEEKKCPCCGEVTRAFFPQNVKAPMQYGERVQALIAYFAHQHFIPVARVGQILEDVFGVAISPGTCANIDEKLFEHLEVFEASLKAHLLAARVLHFDETGMRCEKKLQWVHVTASQMATLYMIHSKRGQEAMDQIGILPQFEGVAVHDHWSPYFSYKHIQHALCNAHHLRELTFVYEEQKEEWAKHMKDLLILAHNAVIRHWEAGALPKDNLVQIELQYTQVITEGIEYHRQLTPLPKGKRGRQKQRDGKNLLDRLSEERECVLRFMHDFSVPFTNNQGEQDIRMAKLKQKIGGCFRTFAGGQLFCRVRSYISTARKQGWNIWGALTDAIMGRPRLLEPTLSMRTIAV